MNDSFSAEFRELDTHLVDKIISVFMQSSQGITPKRFIVKALEVERREILFRLKMIQLHPSSGTAAGNWVSSDG
jgi:hypothetical protein